MARKSLDGTVIANVLKHGTGALNIDGCRIEGGARPLVERAKQYRPENFDLPSGSHTVGETTLGRWPANLIHDGSDEVLAAFPQAPGQLADAKTDAARFFYCAKASRTDRDEGLDGLPQARTGGMKATADGSNTHPTVKPTDLMRYLCRLVTPPGGTVLDPFMGSGSTGRGAVLEGFKFIGCELSPEYLAIAQARIAAAAARGPNA